MADNPEEIEALYPSGSTPEVRTGQLGSLCSLGGTPRLMSGLLRQLLLQHFADARNIHNPVARKMLQDNGVWKEKAPSGMYIETVSRWKPEEMGTRPALLVKEGDWRWQRVAIGDQNGVTWRDGVQHYFGLWHGSHTIFAIGNEGAETQVLAEEALKVPLWFGPTIIEQALLMRFVVVSLGAVKALEESKESYVVPVVVAYAKEESWQLQPDAPRLKRIVFNTDEILGL